MDIFLPDSEDTQLIIHTRKGDATLDVIELDLLMNDAIASLNKHGEETSNINVLKEFSALFSRIYGLDLSLSNINTILQEKDQMLQELKKSCSQPSEPASSTDSKSNPLPETSDSCN